MINDDLIDYLADHIETREELERLCCDLLEYKQRLDSKRQEEYEAFMQEYDDDFTDDYRDYYEEHWLDSYREEE